MWVAAWKRIKYARSAHADSSVCIYTYIYIYIYIYITEQRWAPPGGCPLRSTGGPFHFFRVLFSFMQFGALLSVSRQLLGHFGGPWRTSEVLFSGLFGEVNVVFANL